MRHVYETKLDGQELAAFAAVIELGSFESAAERLHVTPSAVSQRIKALKQRVGQVLVVRQKPCGQQQPECRCCGTPADPLSKRGRATRRACPPICTAWSRMQDSNPRRLFTRQVLWPVELIRPW